jgi:hypothetical protein
VIERGYLIPPHEAVQVEDQALLPSFFFPKLGEQGVGWLTSGNRLTEMA